MALAYDNPDAQASGSTDYTQSDELDRAALLERVKGWYLEDGPHCRKWHTDAKIWFAFKAGDQWDDEDKNALEDVKRVQLVFNRIEPVIDAVIGSEITNRQEVRYIPRQASPPTPPPPQPGMPPLPPPPGSKDPEVTELLTEAARWFRDECDAEHEESAAFADAVVCGMGWTETRLDYEDNPDGEPVVERTSPREMFWDYAARKANLTDARRVYRVRQQVPLEEAQARWPGFEDSCYDATWAARESDQTEPYNAERPRYPSNREMEDGDGRKMVTIVQVQWFEREEYYRGIVIDPLSGRQQTIELKSKEEHDAMRVRAPQIGQFYRGVRQVRKCYYEAFIGGEVLEAGKMVAPSGKPAKFFKFVAITGKLDENKGYFYGLVKPMKDPQRFANKWLSTTVEIMARGAKGGLMLESGAVEDVEEFEQQWSKPGANAYLKNGALASGKVTPKPTPIYPQDFMKMTEFAITSIRDVTGVSAEILGIADRDQPASLEYQRRQSSTTILAPLFDSLRRYRRIQGRNLLFIITEYLSDGRLVRIVGEDGEDYVPLIRDPTMIEYDVIVDDAPSSPSQKELVWQSFTQLMPLVQHMQPPPEAILALLEYSPVPASVVAKIKQAVVEAEKNKVPTPTPAEVKAQEMQMTSQIKMQESQQSMALEQQKQQAELQYMREKNAIELQHKMALAQMDLQMKREENAFNMDVKERSAAQDIVLRQDAAK